MNRQNVHMFPYLGTSYKLLIAADRTQELQNHKNCSQIFSEQLFNYSKTKNMNFQKMSMIIVIPEYL